MKYSFWEHVRRFKVAYASCIIEQLWLWVSQCKTYCIRRSGQRDFGDDLKKVPVRPVIDVGDLCLHHHRIFLIQCAAERERSGERYARFHLVHILVLPLHPRAGLHAWVPVRAVGIHVERTVNDMKISDPVLLQWRFFLSLRLLMKLRICLRCATTNVNEVLWGLKPCATLWIAPSNSIYVSVTHKKRKQHMKRMTLTKTSHMMPRGCKTSPKSTLRQIIWQWWSFFESCHKATSWSGRLLDIPEVEQLSLFLHRLQPSLHLTLFPQRKTILCSSGKLTPPRLLQLSLSLSLEIH